MTSFLKACLIGLLSLVFVSVATAEEAITNFDVVIDVSETGDFLITEKITVNVERKTINRGIFRDLPRYELVDDYRIPLRYKFLSVKRNGRLEPYAQETDGNARRLRIGSAEVFLPVGLHTYEIIYQVKDQIIRTEDYDEVYWNVTGNYWRYPIYDSRGTINLPAGARLQTARAFTGGYGQTGDDARFEEADGNYTFISTRSFKRNEGLSVALQFDKGVIAPEPASTRRFIWWVKNGAVYILTLSLLAIFAYYYRSWDKVGRDPVKDPIFARYGPPKGYSPAAVSMIHYRGIRGHQALIATLMGLAIKNHLKIETAKSQTTLTPLDSDEPLEAEDVMLLTALFPTPDSRRIVLKRKPHKGFYKAYEKFRRIVSVRFGDAYFKWNVGYILLGLGLSILAIIVAISQSFGQAQPLFWYIVAGLFALNILFLILLPAPTKKGQKIKAEIEGFKLYLETAEKIRMDAVDPLSETPPPMSVAHYEAMLPYAIALGVEGPWTKYFEKVMPVEAKDYHPAWSGVHSGGFSNISSLTDSMVSNIRSGVSSAAPQSSSSSSGGGGFSGGGGGGGGGGGW